MLSAKLCGNITEIRHITKNAGQITSTVDRDLVKAVITAKKRLLLERKVRHVHG